MSIRFENMRMSYDNQDSLSYESLNEMSPLMLFDEFYKRQNNVYLSDEQKDFVLKLMEDINETN